MIKEYTLNNFSLVRIEHLNHHNHLFGGQLLLWIDEFSWIAASRDFPKYKLVTRGVQECDFSDPVSPGSILRFNIQPHKQGNTSITYLVKVFADAPGAGDEQLILTTKITFVALDDNGMKQSLPKKEKLLSEGNS